MNKVCERIKIIAEVEQWVPRKMGGTCGGGGHTSRRGLEPTKALQDNQTIAQRRVLGTSWRPTSHLVYRYYLLIPRLDYVLICFVSLLARKHILRTRLRQAPGDVGSWSTKRGQASPRQVPITTMHLLFLPNSTHNFLRCRVAHQLSTMFTVSVLRSAFCTASRKRPRGHRNAVEVCTYPTRTFIV